MQQQSMSALSDNLIEAIERLEAGAHHHRLLICNLAACC